jgi:MoxR-like ATPase
MAEPSFPQSVSQALAALEGNVGKVVLGKAEAVRLVLTGLVAGGHVLLEDVPGVGKTVLAKTIAKSVACDFRRVQFTPDLLPSDILGVSVYDQAAGRFEFKPGPVFTNVLLADEINRATPRTQSALLEAMNDFQVSVDRTTHDLPSPFLVIATQNPYEFEGTYPLPESQLDRFMLRVRMGYPSAADEKAVVLAQRTAHPIESVKPVLSGEDVVRVQTAARAVRVEASVLDYLLALVRATRSSKHLTLGASPRGALYLSRAAQAHALLAGRDYVLPDDVKALAVPVLAHRVLSTAGASEGATDEREGVVADLLDALEVPV